MEIFAKTLYPAPLVDIEIVANENMENIVAILTVLKIIDIAQEKYKAIPNERYSPGTKKGFQEGMMLIEVEMIFPKVEDAKDFAFGLPGIF